MGREGVPELLQLCACPAGLQYQKLTSTKQPAMRTCPAWLPANLHPKTVPKEPDDCLPEEEHQGAQEAAEVVVPVNVAFFI